jgi:hypothetical protein
MRVATVGEGTAGDVVTRQMIARGRSWRGGVEFTYLPRDAVGCITIWGAGPAMSRLEPSYLPRDAVGCIIRLPVGCTRRPSAAAADAKNGIAG